MKALDAATAPQAWTMLVVLLLANVLNFVDRQLPFILAEAIKHDLHLSDTQLGLMNGLAFAVCYSLAALPVARLADRWSAKKVLVLSIGFWSIMTALGGLARSFVQLSLARTGVALGEAGSTPASHALIARTIAPGDRGKALALFFMGAPAGAMLGMAGGGWVNDVSSWRSTFMAAGLLGVVMALLVLRFVPDSPPPFEASPERASLGGALRHLFGSPAFVWMFTAMCLIGLCGYAFLAFGAAYFIRIHGLSTAEAGLYLGLLQGLLGATGSLLGGVMFDRSVRGARDRIFLWPAVAFFVATPTTVLAWLAHDPALGLALLVPLALAVTFYGPALYGGSHMIAGPRNEATATSLLIIGPGLVGGSLGPLAVGMISDRLAPTLGVDSLRWGLQFVPALGLLSAAALLMANRQMARALADRCAGPRQSVAVAGCIQNDPSVSARRM